MTSSIFILFLKTYNYSDPNTQQCCFKAINILFHLPCAKFSLKNVRRSGRAFSATHDSRYRRARFIPVHVGGSHGKTLLGTGVFYRVHGSAMVCVSRSRRRVGCLLTSVADDVTTMIYWNACTESFKEIL